MKKNWFYAIVAIILLAHWIKLSYCVDITDEALYSAMPLSFLKGNRPFFDEISVGQGFGILLWPLVYVRSLFTNSTDGIVLFFREIYFIANLSVLAICYRFLIAFTNKNTALAGSLLTFTFVPYALPSLGYNTLAQMFIAVGLTSLSSIFLKKPIFGKLTLPTSIVYLVVAAFVYPTLSIFVAATLIYSLFYIYLQRNRKALLFKESIALSLFFLLLGYWLAFVYVGLDRLKEMVSFVYSFTNQIQESKLKIIFQQLLIYKKFYQIYIPLLALLPILLRFKYWALAYTFALGIFIATSSLGNGFNSHHLICLLCACSLIWYLYLKIKKNNGTIQNTGFLCIAPVLAGVTFSLSSGNGLLAFPIGSITGALAFVIYLDLFEKHLPVKPAAACLLLLATINTYLFWKGHYAEDKVSLLSEMIQTGPYKGMHTTKGKKKFLDNLQSDLLRLQKNNKTIVSLDSVPAVYLISSLRPLGATLWTYFPSFIASDRSTLVNSYIKTQNKPDLIVWFKKIPISSTIVWIRDEKMDDPLRDYLQIQNRKPLAEREWYNIY